MIEVNYNDYKRILEENMRLIPENHKLKEEIERLNNIIKEKDKDFELLRKAQLKKCQEYENLEKLNNANYQSFIEVNNIINELEKCIKDKYYEAIDYQTKIRQSDLMQGNYPVRYYLEEQNEQLCNYFLNRLKDLEN